MNVTCGRTDDLLWEWLKKKVAVPHTEETDGNVVLPLELCHPLLDIDHVYI